MAFDLASAKPADSGGGGFDLASAKPVSPAKTSQGARSSGGEGDYDPLAVSNVVGAAAEPLMSMGTGAIAAPVSGLAGLAGSMLPGPPGQGADWTRAVGNALTYSPKTEGGQRALSTIGAPFEAIGKGADWAGGKTSEVTGSPAAGAGVNALIQFLPQLLAAKGMKAGMPERPNARMTPELERLKQAGVTPTMGQVGGPFWQRMEEGVERVPIMSEPIRAAKARGVQEFNIAEVNDALTAAGLPKVPKGVKPGNEAIEHTRKAFYERYDELKDGMKGNLGRPETAAPKAGSAAAERAPTELGRPALSGKPTPQLEGPGGRPSGEIDITPRGPGAPPAPPTLWAELQNIKRMALDGMDRKYAQELGRDIDSLIINRFEKNGSGLIGGETVKKLQSELGNLIKTKQRSETWSVREQAQALKEADAAIDRMLRRENPTLAPELEKLDAGYAKFKIAQGAAARAGAREGVNTPKMYDSAVRAADKSKDKARYAEGKANQQDLSRAGTRYMSNVLPDSGTPYGLALMHMILNAVTGKSGGGMTGFPGALLGATMLGPLYSKGAQSAMVNMLTNPSRAGARFGQAAPYGLGQAMAADQQQ